jgi:hypothetical protein
MSATPQPPSPATLALLDQLDQFSNALRNGQPGAREGLLGACGRLIPELSHPSETMLQLLWAQPAHLNTLWMAVEIKLFQALDQLPESGATISEIAAKCDRNADPLLVGRMLRHLSAMGTVRETGPGSFAHTHLSRAFAESGYQDAILYIAENFQPVHQKMPLFFRERGFQSPDSGVDGPFQYTFNCKGNHYFEYFNNFDPEMGRRFASMMNVWSKGRPRWFDPDYYPVKDRLIADADPTAPFLVDVGGGSGHDVEGLKQAFGDQISSKIVLQDRPEIIAIAQVSDGIEALAHDFLQEQPVKNARAYYLHSIIQDWTDGVNLQILKAIVPALKKGYSKIIVNDFVTPNEHAHWAQSKLRSERAFHKTNILQLAWTGN